MKKNISLIAMLVTGLITYHPVYLIAQAGQDTVDPGNPVPFGQYDFPWVTNLLAQCVADPGLMTYSNHLSDDEGAAQPATYQSKEAKESTFKSLTPDEVLIGYSLHDSAMQIYAITIDSIYFIRQSLSSLFWSSLALFRKKLKSADPVDVPELGKILYLFLVRPMQDFIAGKRRLIIIPDKAISDIPFEALIKIDGADQLISSPKIPYLILDFEIVYQFSSGVSGRKFMAGRSERIYTCSDPQFAFLGFSPVFTDHAGLNELPGSRCEVSEIVSLFRQKGLSTWSVSDHLSVKEYFKEVIHKGRIIHLSTHYLQAGKTRESSGYLFWGYNPEKKNDRDHECILTLDEIPLLKLRADLLVLNACASGKGIGNDDCHPCSVPWMFHLAGARNILSTLWSVTDKLAGEFMVNFYREWLSGKTYSEALRQVKIRMISKPETSLPTVWAPYILNGR